MNEELIKLFVGLGVGGVIGLLAIWQMDKQRKEFNARLDALQAAFLAALHSQTVELRDGLANLPGWLQAIHSRLSGLGADSVPPPVAPPPARRRRGRPEEARPLQRLETAPTGHPITRTDDPEET